MEINGYITSYEFTKYKSISLCKKVIDIDDRPLKPFGNQFRNSRVADLHWSVMGGFVSF